ncbi:hypothetical protein HYALB_00009644 [Hymenoscyphus albidus]|uniref:Uncharacterized protein n=1 Tax=Hymenoscyphus albidus TaxID=595503 RepID=A0A9N9PWQ9_9HELO|nr:hypothetical protein HYALB_00009644 [Hymenoscyphus albidus]
MTGHTTLEVRTQRRFGETAKPGSHLEGFSTTTPLLKLPNDLLYIIFDELEKDGSSHETLRAPISLMLGMTCNRLYDLHWERHGRVELIFIPPIFGEEEWKRQIRNLSYPLLPFVVQKYAGQTCSNRKYTIMLPARLPNDYRILFFPSVHKEQGNFGYEVSSIKAIGGQALDRGPRYNVEN